MSLETDDEALETGYGPATQPGDNACNDYSRGLADAYSSLTGARGGRVTEDESFGLVLTDTASRSMFGNVVVAGRPLDPDAWESAAARMHDFYGDAGGGPFLVFSAWPTPDMVPFGFGRVGHPPLMLRAPGPVPAAEVPGLEIRPVSDAAGAEAWEWALVEGFPEPELQPFQAGCFLPEPALRVPGWHHWVGYLDDRPAGTASAFVTGTHVDVEFISTVEWARGRGIGRALTATSTAVSAESGLPAMLIASDMGRAIYERLGFRSILRFTLWAGHRRPLRSRI